MATGGNWCSDRCIKMARFMYSCMKRKHFCDVVLIAGIDGKQIFAHRLVLMSASDYFANSFATGLCELIVDNVSGVTLRRLVEFIYTDYVEMTYEIAKSLIVAAHKLKMKALTNKCSAFLMQELNTTNCLEVLVLSSQHNIKCLRQRVIDYTTARMNANAAARGSASIPEVASNPVRVQKSSKHDFNTRIKIRTTKRKLNTHAISHGERVHKCDSCGALNKRKFQLKVHVRRRMNKKQHLP